MQQPLLIWDLPTRLCHWLMVVCLFYGWFSVEILEEMEQHFWAGYTMLVLVLFRIIWGFVGTHYARFSQFLFPLGEVITYGKTLPYKALPSDGKQRYLGHNPIGSISALLIIGVLLFQTITGLFSNDDYFFGPLSGLVSTQLSANLTEIHHTSFTVIKVVIGLHIAAIIFYRVYKNEPLTKAMITGKKNAHNSNQQAVDSQRLWLAVVVVMFCAIVVYGLANAFTDTLPTADYYY